MNILELEKIVNEGEKKCIGFTTKLFIVSEIKNHEQYKKLTVNDKEKLLDHIYRYWIHSELTENTLFDIIYLILNETNILQNINDLEFKTFKKTINKLI